MRPIRAVATFWVLLAVAAVAQAQSAGTFADNFKFYYGFNKQNVIDAAEKMPAADSLAVFHTSEHSGNLVVYLRLKGLVTPSSESPPPKRQEAKAVADQSKPPQFDLDRYQLGFLRKGPNHGTGTKEEAEKIQAGHMANINKMAAMGKLMAAGPMGDNGDLRGIFLFKTASLDEAKALAAEDPAIKAGRLRMDIFTWMGPKGIGKEFSAKFQADPKTPATMTQFYLVLLSKGPKASSGTAAEQQKILLEHLWNIRRRLDDKSFVAAGPFGDAGDLRGIFVIVAKTPEEAKTIAESDPMVKAGVVSVEMHPWWVAKEVWP